MRCEHRCTDQLREIAGFSAARHFTVTSTKAKAALLVAHRPGPRNAGWWDAMPPTIKGRMRQTYWRY